MIEVISKLNTFNEQGTNVYSINKEKFVFWSLLGILFLSAGFYMYLINATVHNVVARQNLENEATRLTLSIGKQDYQYITLRNNITLGLAHSLGFSEVSDKTFISRNSSAKVSFLNR
jgi:hypothetical protein